MSTSRFAFGEWIDDDHHHHSKPGDFAADSLTRAARSFAFGTTASFFEKFAYASLFKQDPRYHKSEKHGAGARINVRRRWGRRSLSEENSAPTLRARGRQRSLTAWLPVIRFKRAAKAGYACC